MKQILSCCKKNNYFNPCDGKAQPKAEFRITEVLDDTTFEADTIFRDNYVGFKTLVPYDSILWKLEGDPRDFTKPSFNLSFNSFLGTLAVTFKGYRISDTFCFPRSTGIYTESRNLTIVEQVQKPYLTLSPLIGRYHGSFTDTPKDTFTVTIEYFDSTKYDTQITGSKNFYWVSNFPKGFVGTSTPAYVYPELGNGRPIEMGYKSFEFGTNSEVPQGWCRGWLKNDSLTILSSGSAVPIRKFIGVRR
jgi:hypothetical protein